MQSNGRTPRRPPAWPALAYPWDEKILRSEVLTHAVKVVTEVSQGNPVEVVRGPPTTYNTRILIRLAARVVLSHINTTFGKQLTLPFAFPTDLELTLKPLYPPPLPPTPPPVVHVSAPPSVDQMVTEPNNGGGSSSRNSITPHSFTNQFDELDANEDN